MKPPLDDVEWNFDSVPDSELRWCYFWEYEREAWHEPSPYWGRRGKLAAASAFQKQGAWEKIEIQRRFMGDTPAGCLGPESKQFDPVQVLTHHEATNLAVTAVHKFEALNKDPYYGGFVGAAPNGRIRVSLQLDLRNYGNERLTAEFSRLLTEWRKALIASGPSQYLPIGKTSRLFEEPPAKGGARLSIFRTRLDGLGLMRLRHHMEVPAIMELFTERPKPWPASAKTISAVRDAIAKTRENVLGWYREAHPFLNRESRPARWKPYGL